MHPHLQLIVTRQDEATARGGSGPAIPTIAHAATVLDVYRTVAVREVVDRPASWCLTDLDAVSGLGRLIDGPIESAADLARAETALRCILLHEYIQVVVPCVKAHYGNGLLTYLRVGTNTRNDAAGAAFSVAPCADLLFATEYVEISNGLISRSSNPTSSFPGKAVGDLSSELPSLSEAASEVASAYPIDVGASTYYCSEAFTAPTVAGTAGFIDELYRRVYRPWMEVAQATPPMHADVKLPPLLAILLSRAPNREAIPGTLKELREELGRARNELNELNAMLGGPLTQAELYDKVTKINESFDGVVPEALLTSKQRRSRRIASVFRVLKPLHQIYSISADPFAADPEKFREAFESTKSAVSKDSRIVARSVSAASVAEMLRTKSVQSVVRSHFSDAEIALLSRPPR